MNTFEQSAEAMILAQEGQQQLAHMIAVKVRTWFGGLKSWHAAMPVSLPPTEPQPR